MDDLLAEARELLGQVYLKMGKEPPAGFSQLLWAVERLLWHSERQSARVPTASTLQRYTSAGQVPGEPSVRRPFGKWLVRDDPSEPKAPCVVCGRLTGGCCTTKKEPATDALDLDELQRLCDAATPGPWKMCPKRVYFLAADGSPVCDITDFDNYGPIELRGHGAEVSGNRPAGSMDANADFICAARDALPKLIAKVKELEIEAAYWHKEYVTANTGKPCPPLEDSFKKLVGK